MRLSEVLSKAPDTSPAQVENFLGPKRIGWGKHKNIQVGKVIRNYFCSPCGDIRTYVSGDILSCLVTGEQSVSIDATLRCVVCQASTEAWFLVGCDDDLFAPAPTVRLERFTENKRHKAGSAVPGAEHIDDLFGRAQIAFEDQLGAGSMIYLRKIFEMTTLQAAQATGIAIQGPKGGRKPFKTLLEAVDQQNQIIPPEFSRNGYRLFSELSEVIHGDSDEAEALIKYKPCRSLVFGIVNNIRNKQNMAQAEEQMGWHESSLFAPEGEDS